MKTLLETFGPWVRKEYVPKNERQRLLLETWAAFIDEHPGDFNAMVNRVPDALEVLWSYSFEV